MKKLTFKKIRDMFFEEYPEFKSERKRNKQQNDFSCTCRCMFCDFVDYLAKSGQITESQSDTITLVG